jgi:hypothetical protein
MDVNKVSQIASELKKNPMFQLSLGSKELFHSNFIAWLLESNIRFCEILVSELRKLNSSIPKNIEWSLHRELENIDIQLIEKHNKTKKGFRIIIENKLKSIPTTEQLKGYDKNMRGIPHVGFLLAPERPDFIDNLENWEYLSYKFMKEILTKNIDLFDSTASKKYVEDYIVFLTELINLLDEFKITSTTKLGEISTNSSIYKTLLQIRLQDLFHKRVYEAIKVMLQNKLKEINFKPKYGELEIVTFYSNNQGACGGDIILARMKNDDKKSIQEIKREITICLRFQLQNDYLKLYLYHHKCLDILKYYDSNREFEDFIRKYFSFFEEIKLFYKKDGKKSNDGIYPAKSKNPFLMNQYSNINYYRNVILIDNITVTHIIDDIFIPMIKHMDEFSPRWKAFCEDSKNET